MWGLYVGLDSFPMFWTSLVDRHDLITLGEPPFPPVHALGRIEARTRYQMMIQKLGSDTDRFWLGWMSDVDEKEGYSERI